MVWVIDTWVLYRAASIKDLDLDAVEFLARVRKQIVALDNQGSILEQYERCIARTNNAFVGELIRFLLYSSRRTIHYDGTVPNSLRKELVQLGFSDKDLPFVGVACRTSDKIIVAQERHYSDRVRDCLLRRGGIQVLTIKQALERLDLPS